MRLIVDAISMESKYAGKQAANDDVTSKTTDPMPITALNLQYK